eukprot:CAMPEP_0204838098 /NCGR_PEP_ID=MMETSP1346-20131115/29885_1 /ASSEMBLY_ACC=CAM_ASM_000771 /TAXON_ID=215587 /ORGANISM="Aplanochytrium stocchinoi, Strain GSBS06" /LENGTH=125 /DNA_ID=CAMNT_0051973949 /DNA_START=398 /DNA_END=772 /DNA_ORIENTATION=+
MIGGKWEAARNPGVEKRMEKDEQVDREKKTNLAENLSRKVRLYETLTNCNALQNQKLSSFLVDFEKKRKVRQTENEKDRKQTSSSSGSVLPVENPICLLRDLEFDLGEEFPSLQKEKRRMILKMK